IYWGTELGADAQMGWMHKDPLLEQREGILRTKGTSSAVDGAIGHYGVQFDIDGQIRTGKMDVGCDEFMLGAIVNRPLNAGDVGPAWMK
ncbi:MAG: hypothetical protein HN521_09565, partial [Candidatus Latescibacteria bacterium]|nr:hypothetical protein [Candidatus Latescibacterota bacterium]